MSETEQPDAGPVDFWDVKFYTGSVERETVRELSEGQKVALMSALNRYDSVTAYAIGYSDGKRVERDSTLDRDSD